MTEETAMTTVYLDIEPEWPALSRVGRALRAAGAMLRRAELRRERRRAIRALQALDDRMLKDMGLHRCEVECATLGRSFAGR